jgi:alcohol dehydrogenase class IV
MSFVYQSLPGKVIFANGAITQARTETAALGLQRVLVLSTPSKRVLAERVAAVILPHVVAYNRLQAGDLDQVAELATRNPYYNPRPVERTGVRTLLQAAFDGIRPASL